MLRSETCMEHTKISEVSLGRGTDQKLDLCLCQIYIVANDAKPRMCWKYIVTEVHF